MNGFGRDGLAVTPALAIIASASDCRRPDYVTPLPSELGDQPIALRDPKVVTGDGAAHPRYQIAS